MVGVLLSSNAAGVSWLAFFAVVILGALSLFLWKPKAFGLSCGLIIFLGISVVISLVLLFAVPVVGFIIDAIYWMMLCFVGFLWLLFGGGRKTEVHHYYHADGSEELRRPDK